jgi:hypothetical protein|nr:hypothetical protein [uncultured Mediterranean phage uvMED]
MKRSIKKKKTKFEHIVYKKKKYYLYSIKWLDILGDSSHADADEFSKMQPAKMITQAYVFSKDKKYVRTFASYDENEESFSDRNVFPKGVIKEMKRIEYED